MVIKYLILDGNGIKIFNKGNLLGSLIIATHFVIPEVTLYMNNQLFRGNRTTKFDCTGILFNVIIKRLWSF
jgi:hypothetical protein